MAKKSILDLERYRDLLDVKLKLNKSKIKERILISEEEGFDFFEECENIEILLNTSILLNYEIDMAMFSNSIKIDGEEASLKQVQDNLDSLKQRLVFYEGLKEEVLPVRERILNGHAMNIYHLTIPIDQLDYIILGLHEDIYSLNEKIQKAKERIKVEINMQDFILEDVVEVNAEEVSG